MNLAVALVRHKPQRSAQFTRWHSAAQPHRLPTAWVRAVVMGCLLSSVHPSLVSAQAATQPETMTPPRSRSITYPTSVAVDRLRLAQLAGDTSHLDAFLLRSPSTMLSGDTTAATAVTWLRPDIYLIANSATPFSLNDGAMWAGRGLNSRVIAGVDIRRGRLHIVLAPELWFASNAQFDRNRDPYKFFTPHPPVLGHGNGFADPWYVRPYSADVPWRMGASPLGQLWYGQSGAWVTARNIEFGATTENMWWGPGIRNAIVMSDNAAGIPRLEFRTAHPWETRVGDFSARWFVGALSESQFFDTTKTDDVRSVAAAALTWRPIFQPSLTLGITRAVYATANGYGDVPTRWFDVLANTGHPADHPPSDSSLYPGGRDQLISLFARWIFPADGFEAYTEWARQELPLSLHDFVVAPSQSQGYTLGLQYRKPAPVDKPTFRIQAEVTTLEQSGGFKNRPVGVFYTSRRVIQGYTEFGQPIGASIGPGSSAQWIAIDHVSPTSSYGLTFNRIRWNEDVRSNYNWVPSVAYCNHDVSLLPGIRGGHTVGGGYLSGELIVGHRLNAFFQTQSGCQPGAPSKIDLHPVTVSLSFTPFSR